MYEVEDSAKPAGTVVQIIQPGYRLHDRLLRAARVGVAKGGPKPGAPGAGAAEADEAKPGDRRSEEHTSELQSLMRISYAVFCLKKKNSKTPHILRMKHTRHTLSPTENYAYEDHH